MDYNFKICKLCHKPAGELRYHLRNAEVYVCNECGFHYTNSLDSLNKVQPEVDINALTPEIENYIETQLQSNVERSEQHVSLLKEQLPLHNRRVLDIGCGGGMFLAKAREAGADTYGIELDDARVHYARTVHNLNVVKYPIEHDYWQIEYKEYFDAITLWDVIEHVNFPIDTLKSAMHLLKPGGVLALDTPRRDSFYHQTGTLTYQLSSGRFPTFLNALYSNHAFGHKQIISKQEMTNLFTYANLEIVKQQTIHELTFPYQFYLKKLLRSDLLAQITEPLAIGFFKLFKIRNKMIVVGKRST